MYVCMYVCMHVCMYCAIDLSECCIETHFSLKQKEGFDLLLCENYIRVFLYNLTRIYF